MERVNFHSLLQKFITVYSSVPLLGIYSKERMTDIQSVRFLSIFGKVVYDAEKSIKTYK